MALGSTQPLTEMSTSNLPGNKERPARHCHLGCLDNVGHSTSHNLRTSTACCREPELPSAATREYWTISEVENRWGLQRGKCGSSGTIRGPDKTTSDASHDHDDDDDSFH
jgi:hypothetical protein